ncbi:benzoate/H(+) symporter BenE family transporter [Roseicella sp. DB1501]|uniref:benzoate/H(+) symporter BenE family transporter n=1 Tax=Roseicella sp. DB1501 TaxID=2730925 RepID=UPI001491BDF2|nr:benzoate/H(+) symporter BenE family transporter [Roseicella sp. DB1501]NOG70994.1 benzoate/H(+) symporter BenE family transporter [Roseicella sp. DB1501]
MIGSLSAPALAAGLLAGFVGFASSFAVVLQGLSAMGASPAQAASGLMALSIAMGLCGIVLSLWRRMPISVAWSTPGGALLAASALPAGGFAEAVGAFLIAGALILLAGLWRPLGRAVAAIPPPLANAMLAGVLLGLCLAPVRALAEAPLPGLAILLGWALVARVNRLLAVPAAVLIAVVAIAMTVTLPSGLLAAAGPAPVLVMPRFSLAALIGIALPLFLVTMASQNIPGMAVLTVNGYRPAPGPLFAATGLFTLAAAPFGGHAVNLAAITAALCASPEADPDPRRRWQAAVVAGLVYVAFGLLAGMATRFVGAAPPILIQAVAGLALLGAFAGALQTALAVPETREAAVITFLVTASGLTILGISGAFWGLLGGGAMLLLHRRRG